MSFSFEINILEVTKGKVNMLKVTRISKNGHKCLKNDEMSFRLHEGKYGWKKCFLTSNEAFLNLEKW